MLPSTHETVGYLVRFASLLFLCFVTRASKLDREITTPKKQVQRSNWLVNILLRRIPTYESTLWLYCLLPVSPCVPYLTEFNVR